MRKRQNRDVRGLAGEERREGRERKEGKKVNIP